MIFKRLELFGFKSFADKTALQFEPGVTAIVGPNGCGKSNVSDSIRWVLGEQSARLLRGTKMEDIIFNGTDTKSAVNLAEVTLVLSNEKKILPLDYDEISVTRRLYRSGESEYLLNRTPVRLKDILELFMDTGIGTEAYSLIEQGKIDQILSSKPDERRVVFEEAAGITKYKTKKKEALRKLEQTETNLLRVNDIIVEVGRQVSSVERQAQKAARYKEEFEKLKALEIKFTLIEFNKLNSELEDIRGGLAELAGKEKVKVEENSRLHSRLAELRQDLTRHDQDLAAIRSRHSAIVHQIDKDKSYLPLLKDRKEELKSRREDIAEEISTLQGKGSSLKMEESQNKNESALLIEDKGTKEKLRQEKLHEQERLSNEIQACHDEIARSKVELIDIASRQSRAHNELTKAGSELHSLQGRVKRLQLDKSESDRLLNEVEERLTLSAGQRNALNEKVEALRQERKNLEGRLKELHQELTALNQSVGQLKENLAGLNSKREFLEDLKKRHEGFGAGVKALLRDRDQGVLKLDGFYGPLANILEVERGYEQAVESALGKNVESLVVDNLNIAGEALNYLEANQLGEATFLYLDNPWQAEADSCPDPASLPGVKGRAVDFVRTEPRFQPLVSSLLKGVLVVEKMADARNLYGRGIICTVVTLKGEVLKPGSISGGFRFSPAEAGLLGREARIRDLAGAIQHLQEELLKIKGEEELKDKSLQDSESYLGQLADSTHLQEIELTNAEAKLANIGQEKKRLSDEVSIINLELSEATDEEARLKETEEKQKNLLTELEQGKNRLDKVINDSQERIKSVTVARESILVENATLQTVLASLSESIERLGRALNAIVSEIAAQENMLKERNKDLEECIRKDEEIKAEQARLEKEVESLTADEENVRKEEESAAVKRQDVYKEIEGMEARFQNEQEILEGLRNGIRDLEVKSNEKTYSVQSLKDRMLASYRVDLNEVQAEPHPDLDTVQLQQEIAVLKKKIEDMGTVNLAAVEEHKELQERFSFLTAQQADLVNAKESLLKAIQKINQTTKELFIDTFKKIQETFQEFFRLLFGGGEAELVLVGEEDILEAGVEIIARPPGKKPQNITLLSGGEKALTAISLLFAIFKVKPSPFCVLDEIDAPLDESNVDRFTRVLHEFVKTSQFIIITHNKKTIGMADVMYGVTMEQSGVSKIVSVKFKDDGSRKETEDKKEEVESKT